MEPTRLLEVEITPLTPLVPLPQVAAPVLAAPVVTYLGGYRVLYLLAAVTGLAGAVLVVRIKGVD